MGTKDKKFALRIGVIQSGRLIEEFMVRNSEHVTIGTNLNNKVVVADKSLPSKYKLFVYKNGSYQIELLQNMGAEIKDGQDTKKLSNSKEIIKLKDSHKGKITVNKTTILFQFIEPLEEYFPPKKIPPQFRNKLNDYMDWKFMFPLLSSVIIHVVWVVMLQTIEFDPTMITMDSLPDRFREVVIEKPKAEEKPVEDIKKDGEGDDVVAKKDDDKKAEKANNEIKKDKVNMSKDERKAVAKATLGQKSKLISSLRQMNNGGGGGGFSAISSSGGGGGGANSLSELGLGENGSGSGSGSGSGDSSFRGTGSGGVGGTGIGRNTTVGGGPTKVGTSDIETTDRKLDTKEVKKVAIKHQSKIDTPTVDKGIDAGSATNTLRKANKRMDTCYQAEAKKNNSFAGRVKIMITIGADGKPISVEIIESNMNDATLSSSMGKCIQKQLMRVLFPIPEKPPVSIKFTAAFSPGS